MNKGKIIDADKLLNKLLKETDLSKSYVFKLIDELSEDREDEKKEILDALKWLHQLEKPNPLKVAIKGNGTDEYGKKIIEYFTSFGCTNNNEFSCYDEDFYYFMNEENNLWCEFNLPEGYTEISLKEEDEVVTDNSKVNTYLLNRVEELETDNAALCKELTELKLKLKDLSK